MIRHLDYPATMQNSAIMEGRKYESRSAASTASGVTLQIGTVMPHHSTPPHPSQQSKICVRCGQMKLVTEFFSAPRDKNKKRPHCKSCHNKGRAPDSPWAVVSIALRQRHGSSPGVPSLRKHLGVPDICYLCGGNVEWGEAEVDHIVPVSKGGSGEVENLRWTHRECNRAKGSFTLDELAAFCENFLTQFASRNFPELRDEEGGDAK